MHSSAGLYDTRKRGVVGEGLIKTTKYRGVCDEPVGIDGDEAVSVWLNLLYAATCGLSELFRSFATLNSLAYFRGDNDSPIHSCYPRRLQNHRHHSRFLSEHPNSAKTLFRKWTVSSP